MRLKIALPTEVFIDEETDKVVAEAHNGLFCLLPNHIDFVSALVPGILAYAAGSGKEIFLAVNGGVLVKCGEEVLVSTRQAVKGPDLGVLERTVDEEFKRLSDQEKTVRSAMARIEAGFVRRFLEIQSRA